MPTFNKRSSIKCACWNIGGLVSKGMNKLDDKEFIAKISYNDINFLVETHIGPDTKLIHKKFFCHSVCRKISNNGRYYGGLATEAYRCLILLCCNSIYRQKYIALY